MRRLATRTCVLSLVTLGFISSLAELSGCSAGSSSSSAPSSRLRAAPREAVLAESSTPIVLPSRRCANYFLVDVMINERGPYAMLLDTGASQTVVSPRVLRELAADTRDINGTAVGSQGRRQSLEGMLTIRSMTAGPLELRAFSAVGLDISAVESALGTRVDGILGYQAFADVLLTIDYPASVVSVQRGELPKEDGKAIIALTSFDRPNVEVRIGDKRRTMLIDSGKGGGFAMQRVERLPTLTGPTEVSTGVAVGGTYVSRSARLADDVKLGSVVFKTPIVDVSDASDLIGAAALASTVLTFDQQNQRLRIVPTSQTAVTFPPVRGIGAGFDFSTGSWKISHVFPDSPAELAGLQPGDILIRFNGRRLRELACKPPGEMFAVGPSVKVDVIRPPRQRLTFDVPVAIVVP